MLLAGNPPPSFREVLARLFTGSLPAFRNMTDPARLYFANNDLLEVEDDPVSLAARRRERRYVDVFKRVELVLGPRRDSGSKSDGNGPMTVRNPLLSRFGGVDEERAVASVVAGISAMAAPGNGGNATAGGGGGGAGNGSGSGNGNGTPLQWRRCVRCAAVMEDVCNQKPGLTFVLAQQRRCACGGNWGLLNRGS